MIGKRVTAYYQPHNAPSSPFVGRITGEIGAYWMLEVAGGKQVRVLKAACSTKPITNTGAVR